MAPPTDKPPIAPAKPADHPTGAAPADKGDNGLQKQATDLRQKGADAPAVKPLQVDVAHVAERLGVAIKPADLDVVTRERELRDTRRALIDQMKNPAADLATLQKTQDQFKKQVSDAIDTSTGLLAGDKGARAIDRITDSLAKTERHQADLEQTLKVNPSNQQAVLKTLLAKDASALTAPEKDYIETLSLKQALRQAKESGSVTNAVYGSAVAQGLIGDIKHRDTNGMATPSPDEVAQAFMKMGVAHRLSGESREPGSLTDDYNKIAAKYTDQLTATTRGALDCIEHASENYNKNPAVAENLLRAANKTIDGLNIAEVQRQLQENKDNPEVAAKLKNVLNIANTSRMEYASFLYDNGRMTEAAVKLQQAFNETPDQAKADPSFNALAVKVNDKSNGDRNTLEGWQNKLTGALSDRDWAKADEAAKHVKDETQKQIDQADKAKLLLDSQLTDLNKKLTTAGTAEEKAALQAQIKAAQGLENDMVGQRKLDNTNLAFLSYRQGFIHLSEKNMAEANKDFKAVAQIDPEFAKRMNDSPPGELPKLDDLIKKSTEPSWWQSNWRMVAGIGIGIAATAAVIATGGAALPAVAIVLAGGGLYTAAGATAGETSMGQLATNFGVGCATTAVSVLLKGVPMWRAGAAVAGEAGAVGTGALSGVAADGLAETGKAVAKTGIESTLTSAAGSDATATSVGFLSKIVGGVKALPGATVQTVKDVASPATVKAFFMPSMKQLSTELGVNAGITGLKEGVWNMGVKGESWDQVKGHLATDFLYTGLALRAGGALSTASPNLGFFNGALEKSGLNAPVAAFGYGFSAAPQLRSYYAGEQDANTTARNIFSDGSMNSLTFGWTKNALDKYMTPEKLLGATGNLKLSGLLSGSLHAAIPYAGQEAFVGGSNWLTGINNPNDVSTLDGKNKTTMNWNSQFQGRVPDIAPQPPVQLDLGAATGTGTTDNQPTTIAVPGAPATITVPSDDQPETVIAK